MFTQSKYQQQMNRERAVAPFVPYSSHVSENTIVTKDGDFLRIWKVSGISFETADPEEMLLRKEQLNTLLRSIGSDKVAWWSHIVGVGLPTACTHSSTTIFAATSTASTSTASSTTE